MKQAEKQHTRCIKIILCLGVLQRTIVNTGKLVTSYHCELLKKLLYLTLEWIPGLNKLVLFVRLY